MTIFSSEALAHKHILITGATGGIGTEAALTLAAMGASITITGRNKEKLEQLKAELLRKMPVDRLCVQQADLTDPADRMRLIEQAERKLGFINGLVNSAGVSGGKRVEEIDEAFLAEMMNLNFVSTFLLTQEVYSKMLEKKEGNIVNLASLSGLRGTYGNTAYSASKFAVVGWTQSMAVEAIGHGIRVNAVCPGYVDTEMARNSLRKKAERNGTSFEEELDNAKKEIPSGRLSTALEVANAIAFLMTDAAGNIVGESLKISGGSVMR
ncbi:NAD(P)-dependent dehydrogenase (short-subunit alcohol dehydrogenase family) [Planomicrobium stackebrandtii]|uniref:NAD(P)-dependent dehydrogenase (Short-subunit alcohol dehydrogenase family) n=1 Tax=Planomicrobium stackebrandtii TaxID=253160 RepID=A0ABU0GTK2_9BACL|nr:SDR family oxidoreductase [Planomicrobium stackebrandtii]MDQ0428685.1 NAD(P)-dependent dehydrogenase (short-subunit alcohol dehydrogenase family) [Planomicrobium stackebrandtii]